MGITSNLIFSPQKFDFSKVSNYNKEIIYIEKPSNQENKKEYIPCILILFCELSSNFLIYFHGNAENIFDNELFGFHLARQLKINILFVEYQGFSIYKGKSNPQSVLDDSLVVFDFIKKNFNSKDQRILVCGRSLGSSPAIYLASKRPDDVNALITISAFESIKNIGKEFYVGLLFPNIFNSIDYISEVKCPAIFIHGEKDSLISCNNSKNLYEKCGTEKEKKKIFIRPLMTHNKADFMNDIINPLKKILGDLNIIADTKNTIEVENENFKKMFQTPEYIKQFIEDNIFQINNFTKLNEIHLDSNDNNEILILKMSEENFIYSSKKIIYIYKLNEKINQIEEEDNIIYLYRILDNKFIYLTQKGLKIYTFDLFKVNLITKIDLDNPRKIISSINNIYYILGNDFFKFRLEEANKPEKIRDNINNEKFNLFSDFLEIQKNKFIFSSFKRKILISLNIEDGNFHIINENIFPVEKNSLYKFNENEFILIEKSKIKIFNSNNYNLQNDFILNPFHLLDFINEGKILIREENQKEKIKQMAIVNNKFEEENALNIKKSISLNPLNLLNPLNHEIKQILLMKDKRFLIILIKKILSFKIYKEDYIIEIWGNPNLKKDNSFCSLI